MNEELLYEVKFPTGSMFGPFIISGSNPEKMRQTVESRLSNEERMGQPYDIDCLAVNIFGVNEDAAMGLIPQPTTEEEYAIAIVAEYKANLALTPKGIVKQPKNI